MANSYLKAAFIIAMSQADASIIRDAEAACDAIQRADKGADLGPTYDGLSSAFRNAFPARNGNPFGGFIEIFDDPAYPSLDCEIEYGRPDAEGMCEVTFYGEQFGVDQVAMLLFTACKSALPCGFEYSYDCDRLRIGEFGGGAAVITARGVTHYATARIIRDALTPPVVHSGEAAGDLVLAVRDPEHGLSFWSYDDDYDRLHLARVFTESEASGLALPVPMNETEWLTLPRAIG